jgi:hypothetical protein
MLNNIYIDENDFIIYQQEYVVYLTTYHGTLLPPRYIGSTNLQNLYNGYTGSVRSKKYQSIYQSELKLHPELFETVILHLSYTREEALAAELEIQKMNNVVKSPNYFNMAYAQKNGFFGISAVGEDSHNYGKIRTPEHLAAISGENSHHFGKKGVKNHNYGKIRTLEQKLKQTGENNPNYGKKQTPEQKAKQIAAQTGKKQKTVICPHCNKSGGISAMKQWHFDNCKHKPIINS